MNQVNNKAVFDNEGKTSNIRTIWFSSAIYWRTFTLFTDAH